LSDKLIQLGMLDIQNDCHVMGIILNSCQRDQFEGGTYAEAV